MVYSVAWVLEFHGEANLFLFDTTNVTMFTVFHSGENDIFVVLHST